MHIEKYFNSDHVLNWGFPSGTSGKEPVCHKTQDTPFGSLGWEDPLEEGMDSHSRLLAWRIPWTEEQDGVQSIGLQRVGHDWSNLACMHIFLIAYHFQQDNIPSGFHLKSQISVNTFKYIQFFSMLISDLLNIFTHVHMSICSGSPVCAHKSSFLLCCRY